jgi:diadenosine tetraphosphate (Ap4A) HIT family hydrolase
MGIVKNIISQEYNPEGFTIGVNDGVSTGRTVHHLHIHIIPRYVGDVADPRGGVRHIIPGKGFY